MAHKSVYDILFTPDDDDASTPVAPTVTDLLAQILAELKTLTALLKK